MGNPAAMITARRLRVFILHKQGMNPIQIYDLLADTYDMSQDTIYRDLRTMDEWLPSVITLRDSAEEAAVDLLRMAKLAQTRLLQLAHVADSGSAQVGAAKALLASLQIEVDLRTVTGQFKPVPTAHELDVRLPDVAGLDEDAIGVIIQNFMDDEALKLRKGEPDPLQGPEERSENGLDTPPPQS